MRHFYLFIFTMFMALTVNAVPISQDEARNIAVEFLGTHSGTGNVHRNLQRVTATKAKTDTTQPYYIFNAGNDKGFVIVSGDTRVRSILGYSDRGTFNTETVPPQLKWLLSEFEEVIETLPATAVAPLQIAADTEMIGPILTTKWGQGDPYNKKCPIIESSRAMTGCVATAMAQVINHEKKSNHVNAVPQYFCAVDMPELPAHDFDLGNLDEDGIATLMLYCGQAVNMSYGKTESGASVNMIADALKNYFGWEQEVRLMDRSQFNDQHWNRMVKEELTKGHPLLYSAVKETGEGHSFVIDGMSGDLYHVNWGWDGSMDGYFSFQPLTSGQTSEYIKMQTMISTRDDDPSYDVITYGTTIDGINYQLNDNLTAWVLPLQNGEKYRGELVIPSHVQHDGKTYTVNYFGPSAFVRCAHLESIFIPATIVGQEWSIFDGCDNLHKVDVEDMAAFLKIEVGGWWTGNPMGRGADLYLNGKIVKDLVIPEGIEEIGYCKFSGCTSIETVTFPSTLKIAGQYSFTNCPKLKSVDMSKSQLETIGEIAFGNDSSLVTITLPSSVKNIKYCAFASENGPGCHRLKKIISLAMTPPECVHERITDDFNYSETTLYVPDESVGKYRMAKEWCNFEEILPLSEERPVYNSIPYSYDDVDYEIYTDEKYAKIVGAHGDYFKRYVIPASVEYNGESYPVEVIGCDGLRAKKIQQFNAPLKKIYREAFTWTEFYCAFEIPAGVRYIPKYAFNAARIDYLVIPETVDSIGEYAFNDIRENNYDRIFGIECRDAVPPTAFDNTFEQATYEKTPLKVPYGSKKAYKTAIGWRNFDNISNIGSEQETDLGNDLSVTFTLLTDYAVRNGMPINVTLSVRNSGTQKAGGFDLTWWTDGDAVKKSGKESDASGHYDVEILPGEVYTFNKKFVADVDHAGSHELRIQITPGGVDDEDMKDNQVVIPFESFDDSYYRISLIEQFTSEGCSLTPLSSPKIESGIKGSGLSDFVAHATHHCGFDEDFLTLNRDYEWFYNAGGTYTPAMMINRSDVSESGYTPVTLIPDNVDRKIIDEAGRCHALVSVWCDVRDNQITVKTLLEKDNDFDIAAGYDYVTVFLIEDSIMAQKQRDPWSDEYLKNYIHRNTVRKVLSAPWGNKIKWDGNICAYKFTAAIDESWNTKQLKAVAFIHRYDPSSPVNCQVYTCNSSILPQYGAELDDSYFEQSSLIDMIPEDNKTFDVYNILGIKVKSNATDFSGLPAGIYICNGRKVVVK